MHLGGILLEQEIDGASIGIFRIQFVLENPDSIHIIKEKLNIVKEMHHGKMVQIMVKGSKNEINKVIESANPVFSEMLPLTLEELFISEMEVAGYDINKFFQ